MEEKEMDTLYHLQALPANRNRHSIARCLPIHHCKYVGILECINLLEIEDGDEKIQKPRWETDRRVDLWLK